MAVNGGMLAFSRLILQTSLDSGDENDVIDAVETALDSTSATDWASGVAILLGSIVVARIIKSLIVRVIDGSRTDSLIGDLVGRMVGYVVVAFGVVYGLETVGVAIGPVLGALGVIGIALAFALQSVLENFVAGVILQLRRSFSHGDEVEALGYEGVILSIDARTMTVRTPDGETVRMPNAEVIKNPVVNHSTFGRRRTTVEVGIAYGTDVAWASSVAQDAVSQVDGVLAEPPPLVQATAFGASSIDLAVRFWHRPSIAERWRVRDEVVNAISVAFEANKISIPFPQRTLSFDAQSSELLSRENREAAG